MGNCLGGGSTNGTKTSGTSGSTGGNNKTQNVKYELKLLLLGSGESGKSTFFKQIKAIHDNHPYTDDEIQNYKASIYANILHAIKVLSIACMKKDDPFENQDNLQKAKDVIVVAENDQSLLINAHEVYTVDIHNKVLSLWRDGKIQDTFANSRYEFHVFDGAQYFFDQIERLAPPKYVPTPEDILHCRRKTIGLIQVNFVFEGVKFTLFDVGGQRNERRKWANCFEGVSAVLYVACLSEYDQKCYEDDITNRMLESLELFDETINGNYFKDKTIILFLNKTDVFKQKIATKDLTCTFPEYDGGCDFEKAKEYVKQKYLLANRFNKDRIHIHYTCATSKENVDGVFSDVKKFLAKQAMGTTV
jgi:guanine nucleotide-binding protein G(i) subunit alpha